MRKTYAISDTKYHRLRLATVGLAVDICTGVSAGGELS